MIIRVKQLKPGDCFIKMNAEYIVNYISDGRISYSPVTGRNNGPKSKLMGMFMGANSNERVELIDKSNCND